MADLSKVKLNTASKTVDLCDEVLRLLHSVDELIATVNTKAFKTAAANAIVNNDLTGDVDHVTANQWNQAITTLEAITAAVNNANRNNLRDLVRTPVQF